MHRISITYLARNLADIANRVIYRRERFTVTRGNRAVLELVPTPQGRRLGDLQGILSSLPRLGEAEAERMGRELDEARTEIGPEAGDPWAS
jgi:antitoxin (DNA-binding transcriptional repressor) of toxin-antitoxin stability system